MRLLGLVIISASLCWAQKITVEFDQSIDFAKYHTFAIRDGVLNSKAALLNSELTKKQIEADIAKNLTAKGLLMVNTGRPDLNVRYSLGTARRAEVEAYPAGWYGRGTRYVRVPYAEGTLVINFRDPSTQSLVWRAVAEEEKRDPADIQKKLDDMVRKSIDKYPPKK